MEIQFERSVAECLAPIVAQVRREEQTQELRLQDALPDIGRVLGAWGQILVRGKEWRSGSMHLNGGVMVWVLYEAEDGSGQHSVQSWLPFQMKWDLPETRRDGSMIFSCALGAVEARSLSARKLMLRAGISIMGEALEPVNVEIHTPRELPEDVQLLTKTYPVKLMKEAGEKSFVLDEELALPDGVGQILRGSLDCVILEQKVMADKLVFRGNARVHTLYRTPGGQIRADDQEIPFSQLVELELEYGADGEARMVSAVTGFEMEPMEGGIHIKAGLTGQYVLTDRMLITLAQDAYSLDREAQPQEGYLDLPVILDERVETVILEQREELPLGQVMDLAGWVEHPVSHRDDQGWVLEVPGSMEALYEDRDGMLRGANLRAGAELRLKAGDGSKLMSHLLPGNACRSESGAELHCRCEANIHLVVAADSGIPMVTGITLGERREEEGDRPSLVLCRCGEGGLWPLAKSLKASVEEIRKANHLEEDPVDDRILLIPVRG